MLRPVGSLPPVIYWRRRIFLLFLPLVLLLIVLVALVRSGGQGNATGTSGSSAAAASATGSTPSSSAAAMSSAAGSTASESSNARTSARLTRAGSTGPTSSAAAAASTSTPAANSGSASSDSTTLGCAESDLRVEAVTSSASFSARSGPTLYLQVTNTSEHACREDVADKQIVLTVRSGNARIWGSHDCKVVSGKDKVPLAPGLPVRRGIVWSGRTSAPGCAGTRPYAQPGNYDLYAALSGRRSGPTAFTISS